MQADTTTPRLRASDVATWVIAAFGVAFLLLLLLSFALETRTPVPTAPTGTSSNNSVAYFEFGLTADTLWLASTADPSKREALFIAPHAREYGVIPSMSPDGDALVYAALSPSTPAAAPDAPAELWYAPIERGAEPRVLAGSVDLLVPAVWSPDAERVVFRRSTAAGFSLIETSIAGGVERVIASAPADEALFPVAFSTDGASVYFVGLSGEGSQLYAAGTAKASPSRVASLSDGLTRDWSLSPDGSQLAYLSLIDTGTALTSRAYVLDLTTSEATAVTEPEVTAFSPVWDGEGGLSMATLTPWGEASLLRFQNGETTQVSAADAGFDVPLAHLPGGAYLVRSFDGASVAAPGRASLTLVDSSGERHVLGDGDATFAGWSAR